ncbi:MAG: hypothetical protein KDB58_07240 [Solirubrobacterales bacterium]|nr:hypothetical protein [Solirubrobacterales bacterium]MCB8970285.1 hypothetical protein [Thermoleophilales bacterium]MCB9617785.1 hypothetical protein [Sandaracinus sp.]
MSCVYCGEPHVCIEQAGPVCNEHLNNPPPSQLDRIERELAELRAKVEEAA